MKDNTVLEEYETFSLGIGEDGEEYGIYKSDRIHMAVFGFPGTGKSTFLLSQIYQNILDRDGFTLIDPHGDLAKRVLSHIPKDQWDNVIYIDPLTAFKYGRVVQINFLEVRDELEKGLVARTFMDSLSKIYSRFWGPRLDMILLNALYVLLDQERIRMSDLYYVIADDSTRNTYLSKVTDPKVLSFWTNEYPRMPKDASSSVLTKIYRIIQERILVPMFDTYTSSINFRQIMDEKRYVIINLSEGALSSDLANFLGSLILSRIYIAGMSRENIPENERVPHYLYVDEAHRFITLSIKDILEALRKYKVYATLVSQYLSQYQKEVAQAIPSLCDTIITFRVGKDTAKEIEEFFTPYYTYEELMQLPDHYFAVSMKIRGAREFSVLKVIDLGFGPNNIENVIKHSLEKYGNQVSQELIEVKTEKYKIPTPEFRPAEHQVLTLLYFHEKEWTVEEIERELSDHRQMRRSDIFRTILDLNLRNLVNLRRSDQGDYVRISDLGKEKMKKYIPGESARAGDLTHVTIMMDMWKYYTMQGYYVICDTGSIGPELPDLIVYPPSYIINDERVLDPSLWDSAHRFAIEVEVYPEKHPDRVVHNYQKCKDMGMPVIFIVPEEKQVNKIKEILKQANANEVDNILNNYKPGNFEVHVWSVNMQNIEKTNEKIIKVLIVDENENPITDAKIQIINNEKTLECTHDEQVTLKEDIYKLQAIIKQPYTIDRWITNNESITINNQNSETTTAYIRNSGTIKLKLKKLQEHDVNIYIVDENENPITNARIRIGEKEYKHNDTFKTPSGIYTITPIIPPEYTYVGIIGSGIGKETNPTTHETTILINQKTFIKLKLKKKPVIREETTGTITKEKIIGLMVNLINNEYSKHYKENLTIREKIMKLREKGITEITKEIEGKRETLLILKEEEILILTPFANELNTTLQQIA
ncbi:MAG: helicase HerA domain-containing protein, partial [Fervidobacterium sp.]